MSQYNHRLTEEEMKKTNYKNAIIMFDNIYEVEQYFKKEYGCYITYFGNSKIINGPLIEFANTVRDKDIISNEHSTTINYVHNKNTINLIFPHDQLRISGSRAFMYKFPFLKALIEGDFNKDNFIKYLYTQDFGVDCKEEITGSITIILENELESILLDKPITIKHKIWQTHTWWIIEDVIIENMYQLIIQFNIEEHYDKKFNNLDAVEH
jgi:hypothetical protein